MKSWTVIAATILVVLPYSILTGPDLMQLVSSSLAEYTAVNSSSLAPRPVNYTTSLLNDKSLDWESTLKRPWVDYYNNNVQTHPPAMLLMTNFGWNQPNQTAGLEIYRGLRGRQLTQGVVNHPWFHPTGFEDLESGSIQLLPHVRYYLFLDRETCAEKNYPKYNEGLVGNQDRVNGRGNCCGWREHFIFRVMNSTVMSQSLLSKFILFECGGRGPKPFYVQDRTWYNTSQLVFASVSYRHTGKHHRPQDLGLPPPAPFPYELSSAERDDIELCHDSNRTVLLSYTGALARSQARQDLSKLHNGVDVLIGKSGGLNNSQHLHTLARTSLFSACPKGDNLFSYRLTETMSCGSIPVVYADHYLYPFHSLLVNWSDVAIIIPEARANETLSILRNVTREDQCRRRRRVIEIYDKYMKTPEGTIIGLIESLELQATSQNRAWMDE